MHSDRECLAAAVAQWITDWRRARRDLIRSRARRAAIHAWRISSRRLFALERLLAPTAGKAQGTGVQQRLHRAFHASGRLRDMQLAVARLERLKPRFPAARRLAAKLRRDLPRRRRRAASDLRSMQALHRYRVRLKILRFMEEFAAAAGVGRRSRGNAGSAGLQHRLGAIMDLRFVLHRIERFGAKHPGWRRQAASLRDHLQQQQRRLLAALRDPDVQPQARPPDV